jgi:hypothetical protein
MKEMINGPQNSKLIRNLRKKQGKKGQRKKKQEEKKLVVVHWILHLPLYSQLETIRKVGFPSQSLF